MRLIDKDVLIDEIKHSLWDWDSVDGIKSSTVLKQTISDINNMPTIDAVPIVRCKDCKHFDGSYPMCCRWEETIKADDYCSYGEKTEVNDEIN